MKNIIEKITFKTTKGIQFFDCTDEVRKALSKNNIKEGFINIFTPHSTCAVKINEWEENLLEDMGAFLGKVAPQGANYKHNHVAVDGRDNAHSHLLGLFMSTSESIPVKNSEMLLGTWQSIFFIELDGPRNERTVYVQLIGE